MWRTWAIDPEAAAGWFADLLGYQKAFPFKTDGSVVGWALQHAGGGPSLAVVEDPQRAQALSGFPLFAFGVPDEQAAHDMAAALDTRRIAHGGVQPGAAAFDAELEMLECQNRLRKRQHDQ
jgi:hypothetical protein